MQLQWRENEMDGMDNDDNTNEEREKEPYCHVGATFHDRHS
jgi:hypothetical protein